MSKRVNFSIHRFELSDSVDESFLRGKIYAIAEGLCRNDVDFTLKSIEECIPTVYDKPVLAAFNKHSNAFEGHNDNGLKVDPDTGELYVDYDQSVYDNITERPIGTIPQDSNIKIEEYQGKKWLTFDVLIWKKYFHNGAKLLKKLGKEKVSVEITLTDWYETDDGITVVNSFVFDGVTIIGVPEGIEGANIQIIEYPKEKYSQFKQALVFAYEQEKNRELEDTRKDSIGMKFDLKGMGLHTFFDKLETSLSSYRFRIEDEDWDMRKYWYYDLFPDENYIILEDYELKRLVKVPFVIDEDRKVVLDFASVIEVEIAYAEAKSGKKVNFDERIASELEKIKTEKAKEAKVEVKFAKKFVANGYSPVGKVGDNLLFIKDDKELCWLDVRIVEECDDEEEKFNELLTKLNVINFDYPKVVEELEKQIETEKEKYVQLEIDFGNIKQGLENELEKVKCELENANIELAKIKFEKFKIDAEKELEELKDSFGEQFDSFKNAVFELIEKKEISSKDELDVFIGKELLTLAKKQTQQKKNKFALNIGVNEKIKGSSVIDNI